MQRARGAHAHKCRLRYAIPSPLTACLPLSAQVVGYCLRISCVTPVLGSALGMVGVGFASSLAGTASAHARKLCAQGGNPLRPGFWEPVELEDVALDAVMGVFVFKVRAPAAMAEVVAAC